MPLLDHWHMGLLDSLVGNEVKKFVKRKDSDAGEAGLTTHAFCELHHHHYHYMIIFIF